ncbi:MAG: PHP domain-containing protein [Peptococcaceae bacterium]
MHFFGDYHLHTNYSDGRATVEDMVEAAHLKGLLEVGIADHGPGNIGTGVKDSNTYLQIKEDLKRLHEEYPDIKKKVGAEADIVSLDGKIDVGKEIIKELDYLLVGLHPYVYPADLSTAWNYVIGNQLVKINKGLKEKVKNINTKTLLDALGRYDVLAITHPGLKMEIDFSELAKSCAKRNTALEINTGHTFPGIKEVLAVANSGVNFIVNSDAHYPETVGEFEYGAYVLKKAGIPVDQVLNAT